MPNLNLQQQQQHHPAPVAPAAAAAAAAAFPDASSSSTTGSHENSSRVHVVSADDNIYAVPRPAAAGVATPVPAAVLAGSAAAEPEPGRHRQVCEACARRMLFASPSELWLVSMCCNWAAKPPTMLCSSLILQCSAQIRPAA
jgi:hypothetical protein